MWLGYENKTKQNKKITKKIKLPSPVPLKFCSHLHISRQRVRERKKERKRKKISVDYPTEMLAMQARKSVDKIPWSAIKQGERATERTKNLKELR